MGATVEYLHGSTPTNVLERQKRYREKNREVVRERVKRSRSNPGAIEKQRERERQQNQTWRVRALMFHGGLCTECGVNDMRVLTLDHVNGDGYSKRAEGLRSIRAFMDAVKNPEGYQVLCHNCNWVKRLANGENRKRVDGEVTIVEGPSVAIRLLDIPREKVA